MEISVVVILALLVLVLIAALLPSEDDSEGASPPPPSETPAAHEARNLEPLRRPKQKQWVQHEIKNRILEGKCWVEDGDTIYIGENSIRIFGIDAPELDRPYGQQSKWKMVELVKGQVIKAVLTGEGSYERYVARCYLPDGRDIAAEMVKAGLALDMPYFSGGEYREYEPKGVRRKLWEKAKVVSLRHPEKIRYLQYVNMYGMELRTHCFSCSTTTPIDKQDLLKKHGANFKLLNRLEPCETQGCDGRAVYQVKYERKFVPLV